MRFTGMNHIALTVADLERSAKFYKTAFGMRDFGHEAPGRSFLPLVSPDLAMQISLSSTRAWSETGRDPGNPGEQGGIDHFGFTVAPGTNLEQLQQRLVACGAVFLRRYEIGHRVPSLFFADPDGYIFQVTRWPRLTRWYLALAPLLNRLGWRP